MADPPRVLQVLHVEDEANDRELVAATLRAARMACDIECVDTREGFRAALTRRRFDVILSDDHLPSFDGLSALRLAAEIDPDVPFIVVSGTLGEEVAVERLKEGATDYVLKQRLSRLPASIVRAIQEAQTRMDRALAEGEVRRLNADLEGRVAARTSELAAANTALADRQEALRESQQRLQGILDHSPAIIYVKDLTGRYVLVNRQFEHSFRIDQSAAMGRVAKDLFPPRLAEVYERNDQQALASGTVYVEEPSLIDEQVHVFSTAKFPLLGLDGKPYALCGIASDITERKKADDEIKTARLEAERANRAKSEFLSRMSHDLRTPLNAVLGFAQLLGTEQLPPSQNECVQQILRGGQHLLDLINEVLDIARIEAGHLSLSPEPVAVRETVRHALDLVAPLAAQRNITLTLEDGPEDGRSVMADRQRLNQILLNLLSNAVKYNRPGGRVIVAFERMSPTRFRIKVTDTGAGIPRQKLQLLFTPFERLGAESTAVEGTGLGLALSRGLAEAMGGSLGVVSEVDHGSTFWVELEPTEERTAEAAYAPAGHASVRPSPRPATVLYIEDNNSNVRLMERVLGRRPGITLVHAAQGLTGVAIAAERRPDVIFLDMHLPDVPGDEVLRQLWCDPELRRIPVVILSADATPGQVRRVMAAGASAYLTKPLDLQKVLETLDYMLSMAVAGDSVPKGGGDGVRG
jgi:PAS domain S-box-containing protein